MKRITISLLVLALGAFICVQAENTDISSMGNVVYMEPITVAAGSQQTLSIKMKNTVGIQTVQFDMVFPEGVTVVKDDEDFELITLSTARTTTKKMDSFSTSPISGSRYRVLINSNNGFTFDGSDGEIVQVVVDINASLSEGDYPFVFEDIVLVDNESNGFETARVETTITVSGVDDGRLHFDENSTSLPSYTAGEKGDVTLARTIKAGQWSTIVLPFTLTKAKAETVFGGDVQLAEFSGFETEYADEEDLTPDAITVNFATYTMTAKKGMTGGKPFLIKTSTNISTIEADDVTLTSTVTDVVKADEYDTNGTFTGSLVKTKVPADCLFLSDNKFWYSTGATTIKAFRGWFDLGAVLDKETDFGVKFFFYIDGTTTNINEMENGQLSLDNEDIYNLAGQRVDGSRVKVNGSRLKSGIYIQNGKKVVVK